MSGDLLEWHHLIIYIQDEFAFEEYVMNDVTGLALSCYTSVEVSGWLARVPTAIGAALFVSRALVVLLTALHTGGCESAGSFWSRTLALFQHHYRTQELTACHALAMTLGKRVLGQRGHRKLCQHNHIYLLLTRSTGDLLFGILTQELILQSSCPGTSLFSHLGKIVASKNSFIYDLGELV